MAGKKQAPSGNSEALVALAAQGRSKRERLEREQRAAKRAARVAQQRDVEGEVRATLRQASWEYFAIVAAAVLVPFALIASAYSWLSSETATLVMGATLVSTGLLVWLAMRGLGRRALRQEQAHLADFPFDVSGYFEVIGRSPTGSCIVIMELRFAGVALEKALLRDVGGVIDAQLQELDDRVARFKGPELDCSVHEGSDTNQPVLAFMRRALEQVARPLHAASPLAEVGFRRF